LQFKKIIASFRTIFCTLSSFPVCPVCRESRPPLRSSADIRYMVSDACAVRVVLRVCRWTQAASGAARRANDGRCLASSSPQMTPRTLYIVCIHVVGCRSLFLLPLVLQCNILAGWPGPHYSPNRLNTHGRRAFSVAGPMAWNSLPDFIRDSSSSTDCFRRLLS